MPLRDFFRSQTSHERKSTSILFDPSTFVHAATEKETDLLQRYLSAGFPADQIDPVSRTSALHAAVESNNVRAVQLLIQFGAQVNLLDQNLSSPLHIAASIASEELVHLLVNHGADLYQLDNTGRNAFHLAVSTGHLRLIQLFLSFDPKLLDLADAQHWTPLMCACASDQLSTCTLLLCAGARLDPQNDRGMNVFHLAAFLGSLPLIEEFIHYAQLDDDLDLLKKLLNQGDEKNQTPLFHACLEGHWPIAQLLLALGADPYHLDAEHQTCLHAMLTSTVVLRRHIRLFASMIERLDYRPYEDRLGRTLLDLTDLYPLKSLSSLLIALRYARHCQILTEREEQTNNVLPLRHLCILICKSAMPISRSSPREQIEKGLQECFQIKNEPAMTKASDDSTSNVKKSLKSAKKSPKTATVGTNMTVDCESIHSSPSTWSLWTTKFKTSRIGYVTCDATFPTNDHHPMKTLVVDLLHHPTKLRELLDFPFSIGSVSLEDDLRRVIMNYNLHRID